MFGVESEDFSSFVKKLVECFEQATPGTMLNPGVAKGYDQRFSSAASVKSVTAHKSANGAVAERTEGQPGVIRYRCRHVACQSTRLHEEIFGPATVVVRCASAAEVMQCAKKLDWHTHRHRSRERRRIRGQWRR